MHPANEIEKRRVDVCAVRVQDELLGNMGAEYAADDHELLRPRLDARQCAAFEGNRRLHNAEYRDPVRINDV